MRHPTHCSTHYLIDRSLPCYTIRMPPINTGLLAHTAHAPHPQFVKSPIHYQRQFPSPAIAVAMARAKLEGARCRTSPYQHKRWKIRSFLNTPVILCL